MSQKQRAKRDAIAKTREELRNIPLSAMTNEGQVDFFTSEAWGGVYGDDKYFEDEMLEDHFIVFYTYAFAHLGLPRPTRAQYEMALFTMDRTNPHRMIMAMRGLSKSLTSQIYVVWRLLLDPMNTYL